MTDHPWKPTPAQVAASGGRTVPDVIAPGLKLLFCGINPSLYSAAVGHHFARPGNRFWPTLHRAGFTPRLLTPWEEGSLIELGIGIVNLVDRATSAADEVSGEEYVAGGRALMAKVEHFRPRCVAIVGITAYRQAFRLPKARLGEQPVWLGGARLWLLPSPSGRNPGFTVAPFVELREALDREVT